LNLVVGGFDPHIAEGVWEENESPSARLTNAEKVRMAGLVGLDREISGKSRLYIAAPDSGEMREREINWSTYVTAHEPVIWSGTYRIWFGLERGTPTQCLDFSDYMRTCPCPEGDEMMPGLPMLYCRLSSTAAAAGQADRLLLHDWEH
jgi:hypothetical protein